MNGIKLKLPTKQELIYRKNWMNDIGTMAYNAGYDIPVEGYDDKTGCIDISLESLSAWLSDWTENPKKKYVLFIYIPEEEIPIGEVHCYYNEEEKLHNLGILIKKEYRHNQYGYHALEEFVSLAFDRLQVSALSDYIPITREQAIKTFLNVGFVKTNNYKMQQKFNKKEKSVQLLLTKERYSTRKKLVSTESKINFLTDKKDIEKKLTEDKIINVTGSVGSGKSTYGFQYRDNPNYIVIGLDSLYTDLDPDTENSEVKELKTMLTNKYQELKYNRLNDYYMDIVEFIQQKNKIGIIEGGNLADIRPLTILKGKIIIKRTARIKCYYRAVLRDYKNKAWRKNLTTIGLIKRFFHCAKRRSKQLKHQRHIERFIEEVLKTGENI